jgi:hypothetical protein
MFFFKKTIIKNLIKSQTQFQPSDSSIIKPFFFIKIQIVNKKIQNNIKNGFFLIIQKQENLG